jgi:hypothetical protein
VPFPSFFSSFFSSSSNNQQPGNTTPRWSSTTGSRNTLRGALTAQAVTTVDSSNLYLYLPAKFSQFVLHGYAFTRPELHLSERIIHGMQCGLAGAVVGISIANFIEGGDCSVDFTMLSSLCQAAYISDLLYTGLLVAAEAVSEASKDPYDDGSEINQNENENDPAEEELGQMPQA